MAADGVKDAAASRRGMMGCVLLLALAISLVILAVAGGRMILAAYRTSNEVTRESDGSVVAKVVTAKIEKLGDLRVSRITGIAQGTAEDRRVGGMLASSLVMKAPFDVSYFVDLQTLDRRSFLWDEKARTLIVTVPDIRIEKANIDEANATLIETRGLFVTRGAMAALRQRASAGAQAVAGKEALKPKWIAVARRNGRAQLVDLFERPLRIAGVNATVSVRYASEPVDDEQLDRSRSIAEILGGR